MKELDTKMNDETIIQIEKAKTDTLKEINKKVTAKNVVLYHYTSAEGLLNIIDSGKFWATHYRFLNDPEEILYSFKLFDRLFLENSPKRLSFFANNVDEESGLIIGNYHLMYTGQRGVIPEYEYYITGFSEEKDLLSQWRGYGDNGEGFAIGVDPLKIQFLEENKS